MNDLLLHNALLLLELYDLLLELHVLVLLVLNRLQLLIEVGVDDRREGALVLVVQCTQSLLHINDLLSQELYLFLVLTYQVLPFM